MNFDRPSSSTLVRWTATALIVFVALPFILYAVAQFAPGFGGYVVLSDSMAPEYRAGDVVFVRTVGAEAVEPGDVITYHAPDSKQQVTHQVVEVREQDGQPLFQTKGTANEEPDPYLVPPGALIGVVVFHIPYLGQAITFLQTDIGVALFVIVPLGLLVVTELWALVVAARSGTDEGGTGSESSAGATTADDGSTNAGDRSTDMDDATASGSASASADARMDGGGESRAGRTDGSLDESARSDGGEPNR